ncbi:hypothetical protein ACFQAS_06240 [Halopenitus salinus]|uniref:Uncharacterized protein n=1 Tax=Halopenitus salinus TaxID=1198295 RepID=A0ABD5UV92_9EURY
MALRERAAASPGSTHPVAAEFGIVAVMLTGLFVLQRTVAEVMAVLLAPPPAGDGILVSGLLRGLLLVSSVVVFGYVYVSARGIAVRRSVPTRSDLPTVAFAAAVPLGLAGVTKLAGSLTGVPYNGLVMASYAADASPLPIALVAAVGILTSVPILVVVSQMLLQGSFERVMATDEAIVATTVVASVVFTSSTGSVTAIPEPERVVVIGCFALLGALAVYGTDRFAGRDRRRFLAFVPLAAFSLLAVLSAIAAIGSITEGLYAIAHLATFGVAAYAYDRTDSPIAPAIAYVSLLVANVAIVYLLEAGMRSW